MNFFQSFKPISISLSPNTEKDDVVLALKLIFRPRQWKNGTENYIKRLEEKFRDYLGVDSVFSFNSGRGALMAILNALEIGAGEEILLQEFTCNAAVNPILKLGATPIFVDIDDTLNLDPKDLRKKITRKSRAVIIQHTFGYPAQIDEISEVAKENNLYLIEDCAHSLGAKYKNKNCGTFGDAAFFSFGRDKIISSVFGGMAVVNEKKIARKIKEIRDNLNYPKNLWIFRQLLHPILMNFFVLPAFGLHQELGKIILGFFYKFSFLSKAVSKKEKKGEISEDFFKKMPNALALLALNQLAKLEKFNSHRRKLADFYRKELSASHFVLPFAGKTNGRHSVFMRYPILFSGNTNDFLKKARKRKIFLNDGWRENPVIPPDTDLQKMGYKNGMCPNAEKTAKSILNLPTHINISGQEARAIIEFLNAA